MAVPIAIGMLFQTLYFLVDLYFVARLGDAAIAGVSTAGTISFVILALTQMLGVGTVALVSHAVGRKDQAEANLVFNQSVLLSAICGVLTLAAGFLVGGPYVRSVAADPAAAAAGVAYLYWYTPGLALQFALVAMGSALRGTGIVQPTMIVQMLTVILNTVLAPVLIAGWGTHHPLGAAGAGLASSISVAFGVLFLWIYFLRLEHYAGLRPDQGGPRPPGGAAELGADARDHPAVPVAPGAVHRGLHPPAGGGSGRLNLPARHLLELPRHRAHFHLLGAVPGARQHLAVAAEFGGTAADLRAARGLAVDAAALHPDAGLVPVGGVGDAAGTDQPAAAAAGVAAQARDAAGRGRRRTR